MDKWEAQYQEYRHFVLESLVGPPAVIVSPDNDDLPPEEAHFQVTIGSYESN